MADPGLTSPPNTILIPPLPALENHNSPSGWLHFFAQGRRFLGSLHISLSYLFLAGGMLYPPPQGFNLDIEAISGILGSVSIACWVVVFSPQIVENFRRGSADGLSVVFLIIWLAGDVFNILGAVIQGVLPTMVRPPSFFTVGFTDIF
jgi:hypothetical protein